jgi:nitrogen fixation/metabolism regulation signal transduction histidine kinase
VDEKWQAALKGVRYDIEHRILVDGKVKWVREVAVLDFDYKGNMIGGFGTVSDITERKLLEEENKAHEQQLSSMNEELSASNEELRSLNDQLLKSEMELESTNRELLALSKELSRVNSELSAVNYELQTKNEECVKVNRELEESKEKIEDYADDMESLVEKQAKQVFESERRLRAFMDSSSEGFSLYDEHLNLVDANNVVVKRFPQEIRKEDIIGKNIIELYKGIEKTEWYHAYRRVLETGESYHFDAQRGVDFMSPIFLSVSAFKMGSGLGVVSRDVTRRVMAEAALREAQQSVVMERMSAMVAHDIRNPLNIVSQAATTIQSHPERSDRMIELIKNNIERALKMIDDLRYSTRKLSPKLRMTDLSNLVIGAGEEASLNPSVNVSYDLKNVVNLAVDPDLMHRVLDNLAKNAVEVMPNGGTLTFGTRIDDRYAVITVSDTGPGIPEEIQKSLFDPLVTTKKDGLGLGLHFCKRVIEAHGGSLTYTTRIGEGTTFSVRLPIMAQ